MSKETDIFGNLNEYYCWTDSTITAGDVVTITNSNCEFEFDNATASFGGHGTNELMKCYICKLDIIEADYSNYVPEKSNNGGCYAFAECRVVEVLKLTY